MTIWPEGGTRQAGGRRRWLYSSQLLAGATSNGARGMRHQQSGRCNSRQRGNHRHWARSFFGLATA